jgi:hypothetical protein
MQEDIEHRSVAITIQAAKLTGNVLRRAILATLRKIKEERTAPHIGANSIRRLTGKEGGANSIEVAGRIRAFERVAKKHGVRYKIMKQKETEPPKWTVYFKGSQADAVTAAFKEFTKDEMRRDGRPSLLAQLAKLKERVSRITKDAIKNKEHGGPEL